MKILEGIGNSILKIEQGINLYTNNKEREPALVIRDLMTNRQL